MAFVNRSKEGYYISPAGGKKIKVNDGVVSTRYKLQDGDIVQMARVKMHFHLKQ